MQYRIIDTTDTATITEPVTLAELKSHLKLTGSAEDGYLNTIITVTRQFLEKYCRRSIILHTYTMYMDQIPAGGGPWWNGVRQGSLRELSGYGAVKFPLPPLVSVDEVSSYDDLDNQTIFAPSNYYVSSGDQSLYGKLTLRIGAIWPIGMRVANAYQFDFTAGWANGSVPQDMKQAILETAAYIYAHRGDCCDEACLNGAGSSACAKNYRVREL